MTSYNFEDYMKLRRRDRREILKIAKENEDSVLIAQFKEFLLRRKEQENENNKVTEEVEPVITKKKKTEFEETIDLLDTFLFSDNEVKPVIVKKQKKVIKEVEPIIAENTKVTEEVAPVITINGKTENERMLELEAEYQKHKENKTLDIYEKDDEVEYHNIINSMVLEQKMKTNKYSEERAVKFLNDNIENQVDQVERNDDYDFTKTTLWKVLQNLESYDDKGKLKDDKYTSLDHTWDYTYVPLTDKQVHSFLVNRKNNYDADIRQHINDECCRRGWYKIGDTIIKELEDHQDKKLVIDFGVYGRLYTAFKATKWVTFTGEISAVAPNDVKYRTLQRNGKPISTKFYNLPLGWKNIKKTIPPMKNHNTLLTVTGKVNDIIVLDLDVAHYDYTYSKNHTGSLDNRKASCFKTRSGLKLYNKLCEKYKIRPKTRTVTTPSGGQHLYFKYNPRIKTSAGIKIIYDKEDKTTGNTKKVIKTYGMDVKSDYASIVSPPSMSPIYNEEYVLTHDKEIEEIPEWLLDIFEHKVLNEDLEVIIEPKVKANKKNFKNPDGTYDEYFIQKFLDIIPKEPFGHGFEWRKIGRAIKGCGCSFSMFHEFSKITPNYKNINDCERAWKSFNIDNNPTKFNTILSLCRHFCSKEQQSTINDILLKTIKQPQYRPFNKTPCWMDESLLEKYERGVTEEHIRDIHSGLFVYNGSAKPTIYHYEIESTKSKYLTLKSTFLGNMKNTFSDRTVSLPVVDKKLYNKTEGKRYDAFTTLEQQRLVYEIKQEKEKEKPDNDKITKLKTKHKELHEIERRKAATVIKPVALWNRKLIQEVYMVTCDPTKEVLFADKYDNSLCLNMYKKPAHDMDTIKKWIKEHGNIDIELKVHTWLKNHLLHVVSNGCEKTYEWHVNYFGNVLYNRGFKSTVWPLWVGLQGCGKTEVINKIFKKYFGQAFGYLDNSSFAGNGALAPLIGKSFAFLEEVKIENRADLQKLKTLITSKDITYEAKFENPLTMPNFLTGILVSDQNIPIKCNEDQRRLLECRLNSNYINGEVKDITNLSNEEIQQKKNKYFDVLFDNKWQYFCSMFFDFNPNYNFATLRTQSNAITSDRLMDIFDRWLQEKIIPYYSKYAPYCGSLQLFEEYKTFFKEERGINCNTKQSLFNEYMVKNCVSKGPATRKTINKSQISCFELSERMTIINVWRTRTKLPYDLSDDCICQDCIAEVYCKECSKNLCDKCIKDHDKDHFEHFISIESNIPKKNNSQI